MVIRKISAKTFSSYGMIIGYDEASKPKNGNLFHVVIEEKNKVGWRICYLVVRDKRIDRLEQHPDTYESFEPVKGKCILYVASAQDPAEVKCFLLDKPVVLKKGIWHGVVALNNPTEIKITENAAVRSIYWQPAYLPPYK